MTFDAPQPITTHSHELVGRTSTLGAEANGGSGAASRMAEGGAAGAGEGRPLVTMADKSSNHGGKRRHSRRVAADRAQALIRETCGDLPAAKRITACGRIPTGACRPQVAKVDGYAYTSGLQTCGSVWACVSCSFKIRMKRAAEIATAVGRHLDNGGGVLHVVLTMPHRAGEQLADLWKILSDCWGHVASGGGWKTFRKRHDLLGYIRATEATHGWHGWHPHCHILLFVGQPMSPTVNEDAYYELRRAIRNRWCKRMATKYGRTMSEEFGIRVDPVKPDDADGSGQYLTKVGYEMAMTDTKVGREEGHRTPFAIAHDAAETGDMASIRLFREWLEASHGKRSITWSNDLRQALGLGEERSDEELASEDPGGEVVAEIDRDLWKQIIARRDGFRAQLLAAFETDDGHNGIQAALCCLRRHGYPTAQVDDTGPFPVLGLTQPDPVKASNESQETLPC